jgi:hypothetical protein
MEKIELPSFWFIYMGEDGRIGGQTKQYGIKFEVLLLLGTHWEHVRTSLGTKMGTW